ncbi:hypothetical protein B9Z55_029008 [Caenorhabditis nigoni]|uniref:Uncharacterized protein n=1 Tax=Caenorhabditis nigoni TaxID=1611254 RepID=A0A2G5S9H9_9PELO|nr:hypothetical protein B9Z55_029008 [Caenorhabditis nigoni]
MPSRAARQPDHASIVEECITLVDVHRRNSTEIWPTIQLMPLQDKLFFVEETRPLSHSNQNSIKAGADHESVLNVDLPTTPTTAVDTDIVFNPTELTTNCLNISEDTSLASKPALPNHLSTTDQQVRRHKTSTLTETFDPLGFLTPINVPITRLTQKNWGMEIDWNAKRPPEALKDWRLLQKAFMDTD